MFRWPGSERRFTGSYEFGSLEPSQLPGTQWMFDSVPVIDPRTWRLTVRFGTVTREWTYEELLAFDDRVRATLDCTGGFFSTQDWSGEWLSRLIADETAAASLHIRSATGYDRRFAIANAGRLLVATRLGGVALDADHGFPVRLVAPDRRGDWWVKWVTEIRGGG